ncbi:hypothetical protein ACERNI_10270 [Camelimonas sp. ID_303_24]
MVAASGIDFSPFLPWQALAALGVIGLALCLAGWRARGPVALLRALALGLLLLGLANPSLVTENREKLKDIVAVVVDRSGSQTLADRRTQTDAASAAVMRQLDALPNIESRVVEVKDGAGDEGTQLVGALGGLLADAPAGRVAGVIAITDGVAHDAPANAAAAAEVAASFAGAPFHALVTGSRREIDRRVALTQAPRFGIVGKDMIIRAEIVERGGPGTARVTLRRDGLALGAATLATNRPVDIPVRVDHAGPNVIEIEVEPLAGELTLANNRAVLAVEGVREKLRVLLVSGEPHPGERTWRNLLKSDASVDLVHFTILRPPEKQDGVPINELSLIPFPTRELFQQKIRDFDLIIFDRYANQSVLPSAYYQNIVNYVRNGGALLVSAGPEFAGPTSLARTPLAEVLPAMPDGQVSETPYRPALSGPGKRHPVTRDLPGADAAAPDWGSWARLVGAEVDRGAVVLDGPEKKPLLVLQREQRGRVALLLSDHAWLWARNFQGGGPYLDLLRRVSHWLMREPQLEEEALRAEARGGEIRITRQTMGDAPEPVLVTAPDGVESRVALTLRKPGEYVGAMPVGRQGLYRLRSGDLLAFVATGPQNPRELADVFSDEGRLRPLAQASGGDVRRLQQGDQPLATPRIIMARSGTLSGPDWIGLRPRDGHVVRGVSSTPLGVGFAALGLALGALLLVWVGEGRRSRVRS